MAWLLATGAAWASVQGKAVTDAAEPSVLGKAVTWDGYSLLIDGRRVCPVMGEVHYSRIPADEWAGEVRKMKEGGVTIVATYVFWNHIEEQEGIFRWDGQRDLRRFLQVCKEQQMPVVLRIGPFCHGEVRNGGLPDWLWNPALSLPKGETTAAPMKLRSTDPRFLHYVDCLYRQIYAQVIGLQWKDGGPLLACQFDNEYRGSGDYLMALKTMALRIGFDLPFYTRTGWPELSKPVPFGEMLPLYGDYADGFWDKDVSEACGNYYKAFSFRANEKPATEMGAEGGETSSGASGEASGALASYPYFTCELGGGMATAYHRRPYIYPEDAYAMALVKLGSGSNLLGYYMYHGGTNPESTTGITLNETQRTPGTANNDLPVKTYDFQAPLGEYGQTYPQYYLLRPLHLFLHDYGELLAPMEPTFPVAQNLPKGDDSTLRWAVRSQGAAGDGARRGDGAAAFIFVNNYERLQHLTAKKNVVLEASGLKLPRMTIPSGCMAIFPVNVDGIRYATGQLVAKRDGKIYMMQVPGIPTTISLQDGTTLRHLKPKGLSSPVCRNIYLLTKSEAEWLFLEHPELPAVDCSVTCTKLSEPTGLRPITKGPAKVAEAPAEADWQQAAVYRLQLGDAVKQQPHLLLSITYQGDCARLYAVLPGGAESSVSAQGRRVLVADNFQYGRPFLYGLWRLPEGCTELELRILPWQEGAPIYLPREADHNPGERVKDIEIINVR